MLLLIDNFDSFTFNLVHAFEVLGEKVIVARNNALSLNECLALAPDRVVISPGPGAPSDSGISKNLIQACCQRSIPLLGVCLGHQCLATIFGAEVRHAKKPVHGKVSSIKHFGKKLFKNLPAKFLAARYHSLIVEKMGLSEECEVDAITEEEEIMAISHKTLPLFGVQFHPESIATQHGAELLLNFLKVQND